MHVTGMLFLEAAKTYFASLIGSEKLKDSGKYLEKCKKQRRRNRIIRVSAH